VYLLLSPALFVYFRFGSTRTRVLVVVDDKALLVKNLFGNNDWGLPGGGLHRGEAPRAGAARELQEEVGVRVPTTRLRQVLDEPLFTRQGLQAYRCLLFVTRLEQLPPIVMQRREIAATRWVALDDLNDPQYKKVGALLQAFGGLASLVE
jgi:ADP-ribose pyrophosphatase YjhB (NUDIX family)